MQTTQLPYWLQNTIFCGSEGEGSGEGEGGKGENSGEGDGSSGGEGEGGEGGSGSDGNGEGDGSGEENVEGLKSALDKERAKAKKLERENTRLKRRKETAEGEQSEQEKQSLEEAQSKATKSEERVARLATSLRNRERDAAILEAARDLKFIDPTDALNDEIRKDVEDFIDQDDEDPADIDVDKTAIARRVKKLADSKKHLIAAPNGGQPSGGRFSSGGRDLGGQDQKLADLYPSLG